ncbi:MAG: hypothetical protein ACLRTQ_04785 [Candidatus Borkfalkia sp.]
MMRKHMLKKSAMLIISLVLAVCFLTAAAACGGDKKKDSPDNSVKEEAGQVEIVKKDWKGTEGFWEITDNVFYQKQDKAAGRLVHQKQVDQDYITFKAQVKLMTADASAGSISFPKEVETGCFVNYFFALRRRWRRDEISERLRPLRKGQKNIKAEIGKWYSLEIILNGTDVSYYVDSTLVEQRTDCAIKTGNKYFALLARGADTRIKNVQFETFTPNNLSWEELLNRSDLVKQGYDRFGAAHFEYPYVGFEELLCLSAITDL